MEYQQQGRIELPNLAGVATSDLVESIGSGSYKADYINWSRTLQLFRQHAPGWFVELEIHPETGVLWHQPVGANLMLRLRHISGFATPSVPQAVMDYKNKSILLSDITSRHVTDTHRRGACLALNFFTGLAYELWAKIDLEDPMKTKIVTDDEMQKVKTSGMKTMVAEVQKEVKTDFRQDFINSAKEIGLNDEATKHYLALSEEKGGYEKGLKSLFSKDAKWVEAQNKKFQGEVAEASSY